jgi:hypothetical protein
MIGIGTKVYLLPQISPDERKIMHRTLLVFGLVVSTSVVQPTNYYKAIAHVHSSIYDLFDFWHSLRVPEMRTRNNLLHH